MLCDLTICDNSQIKIIQEKMDPWFLCKKNPSRVRRDKVFFLRKRLNMGTFPHGYSLENQALEMSGLLRPEHMDEYKLHRKQQDRRWKDIEQNIQANNAYATFFKVGDVVRVRYANSKQLSGPYTIDKIHDRRNYVSAGVMEARLSHPGGRHKFMCFGYRMRGMAPVSWLVKDLGVDVAQDIEDTMEVD